MNPSAKFTKSLRKEDVNSEWWVIDVAGLNVGRAATQIATLIRGKHKPSFTPHVDGGDFVIVLNADKIEFKGKRATQKEYFSHSGYIGSDKYTSVIEMFATHPERVIEKAVKGMLPKTKLGNQMIKKLKVYTGSEHPHAAQQPKPLNFTYSAE